MSDSKHAPLPSSKEMNIQSQLPETTEDWATVTTENYATRTLVLESPGLAPRRLRPGELLSVGRSSESQHCCALDRSMSRHHFMIDYTKDGPVLQDMGSSNGTFVNFHRVSYTTLSEGDKISAGSTIFVVHFACDT
jgi:pSer/pThr/pTyr-binding forkhead associated (FHA) protein